MMNKERERGFSIIELLVVCAIIGIVASLAIPFLQKAIRAAENGNTFATMRTVASTQLNFYQRNNRFGRITEINNLMSNAIGTNSGNQVTRGKFTFNMENPADAAPASPTDGELRNQYVITATRNVLGEGQIYKYKIDQSGEIKQLFP